MKTYLFCSSKGGVGKTTACSIVISTLVKQGKKVLAIDLDPQGNLSEAIFPDLFYAKEEEYEELDNYKKEVDLLFAPKIEELKSIYIKKIKEASSKETKEKLLSELNNKYNQIFQLKASHIDKFRDENKKISTSYDILKGNTTIRKSALLSKKYGCHIVISDESMSAIDSEIPTLGDGFESRLKKELETISGIFDYTIIDVGPAMSLGLTNAIIASDYIVIPYLFEANSNPRFSKRGVTVICNELKRLKELGYAENTNIKGILLTKTTRQKIGLKDDSLEIVNDIAKKEGLHIFEQTLPASVLIAEAQANSKSIHDYKPQDSKNKAKIKILSEECEKLVNEILKEN